MKKMRSSLLLGGMLLLGLVPGRLWGATDIALLVSDTTKDFFLAHYLDCGQVNPITGVTNHNTIGMDEYKRYYLGWEYVLNNAFGAPVPFDEINNLNNLKNYKLLILSNAVNLSASEQKVIATWVKGGGNLIATYGSGYKDIVDDLHEADGFKLQKGGTGGLHQLWGDPLNKLFGSGEVDFDGVDIAITRDAGPTAGLPATIRYAWAGNMLIQRQETSKDVYAMLLVDNWTRPQPAILYETPVKGKVVYYAFAPEYIISLRGESPRVCPGDIRYPNWAGSGLNYFAYLEVNAPAYANWSANLVKLMKTTIQFLHPGL